MNGGGGVGTEAGSSSKAFDDSPEMSKRRLPRFRLRTLLILGLAFSLFSGWVGMNVHHLEAERRAIEALNQAGARFGTASARKERFEDYDPLVRLRGGPDRPKLESIFIESDESDDPDADRAMAALAFFPEVKAISLRGRAFDDASLAHVGRLRHIETLSLSGTEVTAAGMADLRATPIRRIDYSGGAISAELVSSIAALPCLNSLSISYSRPIEPLSYRGLERANRLEDLSVRGAGFDDEDVPAAASLERLEKLSLEGISDEGLEELADLSTLRELSVYPPVTIDAAARFSKRLPNCSVVHLGGPPIVYRAGEGQPSHAHHGL